MDNRKENAAAPIPQIDYDDMAKAIAGVLSAVPMTAAEINAALGTDYTPLQISNAMQRISGASAGREVRMTVGASGRRREKEYAVYTLHGTGAVPRPSAGALREKKPPQAAEGQKIPLPEEYIAAKRRKRAKATAERAKAIAKVLGSEPMTMREINAALGTDYGALQVSNAVRSIPGAKSCEVMRTVTNSRGEKVERVYAAYFLK